MPRRTAKEVHSRDELAARYEVMSIPTVMIFRNGKISDRIVGAAPAQAYRQGIDAALGTK
jgi:thioredoxin 1